MEREIRTWDTFVDGLDLHYYRNDSPQCEVLQEGRRKGKAYC